MRSLPRGDRTFERSPHRRSTSASVRASRLNVRSSRGHLMTASADAWSSRAGGIATARARGNAPLSELRAGNRLLDWASHPRPASRILAFRARVVRTVRRLCDDSVTTSCRICPMPPAVRTRSRRRWPGATSIGSFARSPSSSSDAHRQQAHSGSALLRPAQRPSSMSAGPRSGELQPASSNRGFVRGESFVPSERSPAARTVVRVGAGRLPGPER